MFHSQSFFQVKLITLPRNFLKMRQLIAFGKDALTNVTYGPNILLTTILQQ